MNLFKNGILFFFLIVALGLSSCSKEECIAPVASQNIIGVWLPQISGGEVEFKADGTLIDPSDAIFGVEVNGVVYDQKTYVVTGTDLTVTAMPSGSTDSSSADFVISQNECDEIKITIIGVSETLVRK